MCRIAENVAEVSNSNVYERQKLRQKSRSWCSNIVVRVLESKTCLLRHIRLIFWVWNASPHGWFRMSSVFSGQSIEVRPETFHKLHQALLSRAQVFRWKRRIQKAKIRLKTTKKWSCVWDQTSRTTPGVLRLVAQRFQLISFGNQKYSRVTSTLLFALVTFSCFHD